jgi:predicted metalloprotease with PDZ domain
MKKIFAASVLALLLSICAFAQQPVGSPVPYRFSLDLNVVKDDRLMVSLVPPALPAGQVSYRIPKIVPGTYEVYDFGRFVHDFKAYDKSGKELAVEHPDPNTWQMPEGKSVAKITYWVEDTYDTKIKDDFVFEPAGTNIEEGKNFMLNTFGFFGYFDGMKQVPFQLNITKPQGFYGATGLTDVKYNGNVDTYTIQDYNVLADSPIMYSVPDTAIVDLGDAKVLVSVYSPNKKVTSRFLANTLREILVAQRDYLGGKLPVEKYAFLFYFYKGMSGSGHSGALEHCTSSVYSMMELKEEYIVQSVKDIAAHEFFHIVTPLTIHSEEIGDFDFINPVMSKHLWLYEGVTEYCAGHVQVKQGLMDVPAYIDVVRSKMSGAERYRDDIAFTELSKGCLDKHKEQYGNVYEKGALIGMCLDIKLRHLSDGQYGLQDLMRDLARTYGKDRSFKDDELIQQIVKLTYPEIGEFFSKHVAGNQSLPVKEVLGLAGFEYKEEATISYFTLGGIGVKEDPKAGRVEIDDVSDMNEFGKKMGYKQGDVIIKINETEIKDGKLDNVLNDFYATAKAGGRLTVTVLRKDAKGKERKVKLKGKLQPIVVQVKHHIQPIENASEKQLKVRKAWLGRVS